MSNIAAVIGWKFNHQPGMETVDGAITKFPGGIPSAEDQAAWAAEYEAHTLAVEKALVLADFRAKRDVALPRLNGIASQESRKTTPDQVVIGACDAAIDALKAMPQHQTVLDAVGGEATEDALQLLYAGIAAQLFAASPYAYTAFRGLDL